MHAVSLCAGIGGIDLALTRAGIPTVAAVEINDAARGVLADRFPHLTEHGPNKTLLRNLTEVSGDDLKAAGVVPERTVVTAGWPCQGNSVAGRRRGLADPRSGLWVHIARLLAELRPRWFIGENVPGLLSVNHGHDFATVLEDLAGIGMELCWRILDARYFGVPQRRRRLIIVGHLGDQRTAPAQVLLEPESERRDSAPRHETRPKPATNPRGSAAANRQPILAGTPEPEPHRDRVRKPQTPETPPAPREDNTKAGPTGLVPGRARSVWAAGVLGDHTHTLTALGHDASEDGTGRGTPVIGFAWQAGGNNDASGTIRDNETPTLPRKQTLAVAYAPTVARCLMSCGGNDKHDPTVMTYVAEQTSTLQAAGGQRGQRIDAEGAAGGHLVAFRKAQRAHNSEDCERWQRDNTTDTLDASGHTARTAMAILQSDSPGPSDVADVIVRRLTPLECERLQGLPDGWTVASNGRPQADSPRYQQLGNAVAVPVLQWVAHRVASIDATHSVTGQPATGNRCGDR